MIVTLKPCPYCGGAAKIKTLVTNCRLSVYHRDGMIYCENGDIKKLFNQKFTVDEEFQVTLLDNGFLDAVEEWNNRIAGNTETEYKVITSDGYTLYTSDGYLIKVGNAETEYEVVTSDGYTLYTSDNYLIKAG